MSRDAPAPGDRLDAFVQRSRSTGLRFLARYRALRLAERRRGEPHHPRALAIAAEILRPYPRIVQTHVHALLGGAWTEVRAAQRAICTRLGHAVPQQTHVGKVVAGKSDELSRFARAELGPLPGTCVDPDLREKYRAPAPRYAARVLDLVDPNLRSTAALSLLLAAADRLPGPRITNELKGWEALDRFVAGTTRPLAPAQLPARLLEWLRDDPSALRLTNWRLIAQGAARITNYLATHPAVAARNPDRCLAVPPPAHYRDARGLAARLTEQIARRRAATADPVADHLPELLELGRIRCAEIAAIHDAFDEMCASLTNESASRHRFAVTLPRTTLAGSPREGARTVDLSVVRGADLRRRIGPLRPRPPGGKAAEWLLLFDGVRDPQDEDDTLPILECYRRGLFAHPACRNAAQETALHAWTGKLGRVPPPSHRELFLFPVGQDRELADQCYRRGLALIPIGALHHGLAIAHAVARTGLIAGARISETLQQCRRDDAFGYDADRDLYWFRARPKGKSEQRRFYIDEATMRAIQDVAVTGARNGWPLRRLWNRDTKDYTRALYQARGHLLDRNAVNGALQMLLLGHPVRSHDLRAGFSRFADEAGAGRHRLQATLNHDSPASTRLYAQATERRKAELAARLAGRLAP